jgi:hypothetical protein
LSFALPPFSTAPVFSLIAILKSTKLTQGNLSNNYWLKTNWKHTKTDYET